MNGKRGRKSAAERATTPVLAITNHRPSPPASLTDAEAEVWRGVVNSLPADWIVKGARPLLASYCRHVVTAELLSQQVRAFRPEWLARDDGLERMNKLLMMLERESRAMTACARALRLTPHSQMRPLGAGRALAREPEGARPWDT